ncbi:competence protein ComEA [Melghiribacillus thermohalophilus]|uniref:Competence protein ComEA n=1 Tax=Melghiribacillus thermohalophilus TaxID=1324956 RepID=A0A4R3NDP2_9BACI|nr:helix-hairpin-helix domain-containing protein [Melghiribacillus thermohalophilus]TCT27046.1 competence protein ComEA [Melghiribacillus thermohalophilus]
MRQTKDRLFVLGIILLVVIFAGVMFWPRSEKEHAVFPTMDIEAKGTETSGDNDVEKKPSMVMVDIKGEVRKPGVYQIDEDSRVKDAVELAGGLTNEADELSVNLAQKIYDEMVIIVAKKGEADHGSSTSGMGQGQVRINSAGKEEIETLPGIGPSKAEAIIQYREDNGPFKKLEDLLNVSGIGPKTLENIKEFIIVP